MKTTECKVRFEDRVLRRPLHLPIGFVTTPYKRTSEVPKGPGAKHEAEGVVKILPEFVPGLSIGTARHDESNQQLLTSLPESL
jgi:hypothetical protein